MNRIESMWYVYDQPYLYLKIRSGRKIKKFESPIKPYFFVKKKAERIIRYFAKKNGIRIKIEKTDLRAFNTNDKVIKVYVEKPKDVKRLRDIPVPVYEADIPFDRRVRLDEDWRTSDSYSKLYWDIECLDSLEIGGNPIISIGCVDERGKEFFLYGEEDEIINEFIDLTKDYSMLIGWNTDAFDVPVLMERCKRLGIERSKIDDKFLPHVRWVDLLLLFRASRQRMTVSESLDYIARFVLGKNIGKKPRGKISEMKKDELREYNLWDCHLCKMIDEELSLTNIYTMLGHRTYVFPDQTVKISRCIDSVVLRKAREMGYVLPNRLTKKVKETHSGALVLEPPEPYYLAHNVLIVDFTSLYPHIMLFYRISPDLEGRLYPELIDKFLKERLRLKRKYKESGDMRAYYAQKALKRLLNSMYGYLTAPNSRIFDFEKGDRVATIGRNILMNTMRKLEREGFKIVYGDTDSMFIELGSDFKLDEDRILEIEDHISEVVKEITTYPMPIEAEMLLSKLYFFKSASGERASKKKYAGLVIWTKEKGFLKEEKFIEVGLETVRSDWFKLSTDIFSKLILYKLKGMEKERLRDILLDIRDLIYTGSLDPEDFIISKKVTRRLSEYKVIPPHVRAAIILQKKYKKKVYVGEKIPFLVVKGNKVEPFLEENKERIELDKDYYWGKIVDLADRLLGVKLSKQPGSKRLDSFI